LSSSGLKPGSINVNPDDIPAIHAGDLVEHPKFGKGIVLSTERWKKDLKVRVEFDDKGIMQMIQSVAKLQPVKDFS